MLIKLGNCRLALAHHRCDEDDLQSNDKRIYYTLIWVGILLRSDI